MLNHNNKILCNDHEIVKVFNEHYINIIKKSSCEKPTNITEEYSFDNEKQAIEVKRNSYKNHPSILKIRSAITCVVLLLTQCLHTNQEVYIILVLSQRV